MVQRREAGQDFRLSSANKVSLVVRRLVTLADKAPPTQSVKTIFFTNTTPSASGSEILHRYQSGHLHSALADEKQHLHPSQPDHLQELLHWGSARGAQTEVSKGTDGLTDTAVLLLNNILL